MKAQLTTVSAVAFAVAFATQAYAQNEPRTTAEQPEGELLAAPTKALEVVVGSGYTQGFGELEQGVNMKNVATPGLGVDVGASYRFNPRWSFGVAGAYQEYNAVRANAARGMTAGLAIAYHGMPYSRVDPWIQFGAGYRALWETNPTGPDLLTQGLELGKLTVGLDLRSSRNVAISPVIGADLSVPLWQGVAGSTASTISNPAAAVYVFAGLQARFDVTSAYETGQPPPQPVQQATITEAQVPSTPPAPQPQPTVSVSEEVKESCAEYLDNPEQAPKFDFDKSEIKADDVDVLEKVSKCFASGPLKNDRVLLIGRADPRGSVAYNNALGMRRAKAVADFFEKNGVEEKRIQTVTRGKLDATGTDAAGWARDRRVDMLRIEIDHGTAAPEEQKMPQEEPQPQQPQQQPQPQQP